MARMAHASKTPGYKLSFTAASLSLLECVKIAEVYLRCGDWNQTKEIIRSTNLLQSRTNSRNIRTSREIMQRLELLTNEELRLLVDGNLAEQRYVLWFAVCRTYELIKEFAIEVLHEKFLSRAMKVTQLDYDAFFNRKADWVEHLDRLTPSTKNKLRTVVFLMMREADLITEDGTILEAILSSRLIETLRADPSASYRIFPAQPF